MVELQNKLSEESKKADKMEFEYKRLKEKVDSLQKEKDVRARRGLFSDLIYLSGLEKMGKGEDFSSALLLPVVGW